MIDSGLSQFLSEISKQLLLTSFYLFIQKVNPSNTLCYVIALYGNKELNIIIAQNGRNKKNVVDLLSRSPYSEVKIELIKNIIPNVNKNNVNALIELVKNDPLCKIYIPNDLYLIIKNADPEAAKIIYKNINFF